MIALSLPIREVKTGGRRLRCIDLKGVLGSTLAHLPVTIRLLCENYLRRGGDAYRLCSALDRRDETFEFAFHPNRLLMHDTTCTPALVDIAAMRDVMAENGADPARLSPSIPVDVSIDHSLAVNAFARADAARVNLAREMRRNAERYRFLKWAGTALGNVTIHPPGTGIMHTINLEQLSSVVMVDESGFAHPDMVLGTDSHTPMVNGIGVLGWGIGGLEAEALMLGQAATLRMPKVVGVRLSGAMPSGVLATDLALVVTARLREVGVAGAWVEFFGSGVSALRAEERAVVANMAPEYGATTGYFPVDRHVVDYLRRTARSEALVRSIEPVCRALSIWFDQDAEPAFDEIVEIDLASLSPTLAGPRRPQDRLAPKEARTAIESTIGRPLREAQEGTVPDAAVGIAAITSCTNTSDPRLLIAAGLMARKARRLGLAPPRWVKTSLAPGSPSSRSLLERAGLLEDLGAVGFGIVGFGCTTCIGNSGSLPDAIEEALAEGKAIAAVLSGNRNFPGRVHPKLDLGFLGSPPLVLAYALKGQIDGDILSDPVAYDDEHRPVYLTDLWPSDDEIDGVLKSSWRSDDVPTYFAQATQNRDWQQLDVSKSVRFPWDPVSRTLRRPKFVHADTTDFSGRIKAAPLLVLDDDITTDHISPAGRITSDSAAGQWLISKGGDPSDLNVFASYRGNWHVMIRGLFTNASVVNRLAKDIASGSTILNGQTIPLFEAARHLEQENVSGVILAGSRYGMGSSRDWAAKGTALIGVRTVIARSFERIHRANLIGMGIVPLEICCDFIPVSAGIAPDDRISLTIPRDVTPGMQVMAIVERGSKTRACINTRLAIETSQEVEQLRHGGMIAAILRKTLSEQQ